MKGMQVGRIVRRTEWAPGLITITLDVAGGDFSAGQFFNLGLHARDSVPPEGESRNDGLTSGSSSVEANSKNSSAGDDSAGVTISASTVRRSYSASSAPGAPLEFFISEVPEGELTPRMFQLSEGNEVLVDVTPRGFFTLSQVPEAKTLWLVGTGTGLGPYVSMLRARTGLERFDKIVLVHGVRVQAQLAYAEELHELTKQLPLTYLPMSSRDAAPLGGLAGRITSAFESGELEARAAVPMDANAQMLLCGNPAMIDDMVALLKGRGLAKHRPRSPGNFHYERYW